MHDIIIALINIVIMSKTTFVQQTSPVSEVTVLILITVVFLHCICILCLSYVVEKHCYFLRLTSFQYTMR